MEDLGEPLSTPYPDIRAPLVRRLFSPYTEQAGGPEKGTAAGRNAMGGPFSSNHRPKVFWLAFLVFGYVMYTVLKTATGCRITKSFQTNNFKRVRIRGCMCMAPCEGFHKLPKYVLARKQRMSSRKFPRGDHGHDSEEVCLLKLGQMGNLFVCRVARWIWLPVFLHSH